MSHNRQMIFLLVIACALVGLFLFIRIVQYEPLYPKAPEQQATSSLLQIPILPNDPILGNARAPKTIIAFADFACDNCHTQLLLLQELQTAYPDQVKIIFKGLSVTRFPQDSTQAHRYAVCMQEQKQFDAYKDYVLVNYQNLSEAVLTTIVGNIDIKQSAFDDCLASSLPDDYLEQNKSIARQLGIQSVPAFFVNHKQIQPPLSVDGWKTLLGL